MINRKKASLRETRQKGTDRPVCRNAAGKTAPGGALIFLTGIITNRRDGELQ
jgi:hypothetical protein